MTASWYSWRGPGRIGISWGAPRGIAGGYRFYKALAPTRDMISMPPKEFEPLYAAILAKLDARATWDELHRLAGGVEPVLLCFESLPFTEGNFCHRRRVASWFKCELGEDVPEYDPLAC
jgi:hypothetical protein